MRLESCNTKIWLQVIQVVLVTSWVPDDFQVLKRLESHRVAISGEAGIGATSADLRFSTLGSTDLRISTTDLDHGVAVSVEAGDGSGSGSADAGNGAVRSDTKVHVRSIGYNLQVQIIFSNIELNQPTTFKETSVRPLMDTAKLDPLHVLPIFVQEILGFISSGDPTQARCGYMARSWVLNHRLSDFLGSRVLDPGEGVSNGSDDDGVSQIFVSSNSATTMAAPTETMPTEMTKTMAVGIPTKTTPTAPLFQIHWILLHRAPTQLDLWSGSVRSTPIMIACLALVCSMQLVLIQMVLWLPFPLTSEETGWTVASGQRIWPGQGRDLFGFKIGT